MCNYLDCFVDSIASTLCLPSLCGMLVYSEDTSMDASKQFEGIFMVSINLRNSVEFLRYEGSFFTCGCSHL